MLIENFEKRGTEAVQTLRKQKLAAGNFFMINVPELPANECYLEYPNGSILLVTFSHAGKDLEVIKQLSVDESEILRTRYQLY